MYLLLVIIRRVLGLLSGGAIAVRRERAWRPFQGFLFPGRAGVRQPCFPTVEWMSVRPVPKRFHAPPDCYYVVPVTGQSGGGRRLAENPPGAAGPFPTASHYRPVLI